MATIHNLTNLTNTTNLFELASLSNDISFGIAGTVIITSMFLITFVALKGWSNTDALAASSFGYGVIALLFFVSGLIPSIVFFTYLIIMLTGLTMLLLK